MENVKLLSKLIFHPFKRTFWTHDLNLTFIDVCLDDYKLSCKFLATDRRYLALNVVIRIMHVESLIVLQFIAPVVIQSVYNVCSAANVHCDVGRRN